MAPRSLRLTTRRRGVARNQRTYRRDVAPAQDRVRLPLRRLPPVRDGGDADLAAVPAGPRRPRTGRGATGPRCWRRSPPASPSSTSLAALARAGRSPPGADRRGDPEHRPTRHGSVVSFPMMVVGQALVGVAFGLFYPVGLASIARMAEATRSGHRQLRPRLLDRSCHLAVAADVGEANWRWVFFASAIAAAGLVVWTGRRDGTRPVQTPSSTLFRQLRAYAAAGSTGSPGS